MPVRVRVPPTVTVSVSGTQGPRGNTILPGTGAPGVTVGINGDFYFDLADYPTTATLYGPKASGHWPAEGVVVGGGGVVGALLAANDLSDLDDTAAARGNLGLGAAARLDVGALADTVAAGDDSRFGTLNGTIRVTGTPAAGKVPQLTSPTAAVWAAIGGGGGPDLRSARARITNDNLAGLPSAPSWTTVLTSAGTPLQATIPAAIGDRLLYLPSFMYIGSHFLDWALLAADGVTALQYATSDTSTPSGEGNPSLYPALTFSKDPGPGLFTVTADSLRNGAATVALQHQGTNAGLVYAHTLYPWIMWIFNFGPEPA